MKFDSSIYLFTYLTEVANISLPTAKNILRLLAGFVVVPSSCQIDEESQIISLQVKLPNSQFVPHIIYIKPDNSLSIYGKIKDYPVSILHINIELTSFKSQSVLLIDDSSDISGIYYHKSSSNINGGTVENVYTFYDRYTLESIKKLAHETDSLIEDIIENTPAELTKLGYLEDQSNTSKTPAKDKKERAIYINREIRSLDRTTLENYISKVQIPPSEDYIPIHDL